MAASSLSQDVVVERAPTKGGEYVLLLILSRYVSDDKGYVCVSINTLAKDTRQVRRNIQRQLGALKGKGLIESVRMTGSQPTEYRICIEKLLTYPIYGEKTKPAKKNIPSDLRWLVFERDNFTCLHCGARRRLSADHIIPFSKGGPTTFENLQTLCHSCNTSKGTKMVAVAS